MSRPTCAACGKPLTLAKYNVDASGHAYNPKWKTEVTPFTADGLPPTRGKYGDNLVCKQACGYLLALRLVAMDPGILALLPPAWQPTARADEASVLRKARSRERRKRRKEAQALLADTGKTPRRLTRR